MNILIISETYYPFISGVSSSTQSIASFMHDHGHNVILITPKGHKNTIEKDPFQIVRTPAINDPFYKGKTMTPFPFGLPTICKTVSRQKTDIIHIQEPGSLGISGLIVAKFKNVTCVGALHFTPDQAVRMIPGKPRFLEGFFTNYQRFYYNQCDGVMIPTATFADYLTKIGVKTPKQVVSNGVNTDEFHPPSDHEKQSASDGKTPGTVEFYYLGRLNKDKNVQAIIEALPDTDENVRIIIAGEGNDRQSLKIRAKELKVDSKIIWLESLNQEEMVRWYFRADAFILMALYEIQSIVTLQALACGLPVVLARRGALPELVDEGKNGYLVDPDKKEEIAGKINLIARNPNLIKQMSQFSRSMSLKHHKPTVLAKLENFYQELLSH